MEPKSPANRFWEAGAVFLLLAIMATQLVLVSRATSATWDEPHHLFDGYTVWKLHDYRLNPEVPPLVKMVAAIPLLGKQLSVPVNQGRAVQTESFTDGRAFVYGNGGDQVLFPARMACAGFTLLLGLLLYGMAREIFGPLAALFALALFVVDPNFIANGALVTTDVSMSCVLLGVIYAWFRYAKAAPPALGRLAVVAVAAGLALVVKFTGLLAAPTLVLLAIIEAAQAKSLRLLGRRLAALLLVGVVAYSMLWAFYGFRYSAGPVGEPMTQPLATYLSGMPNPRQASELRFVAQHHLLPEAYIWGLANTKITEDDDTTYFFGRVYRHGQWKYFPAAFLIKSTLPLLMLLVVAPFALGWRWFKEPEWIYLLLPVVVYGAVAVASKMNIGHRHLLPVYAFLYLVAAGAGAALLAKNRHWGWVLGFLLVWQIATSARVAPGYMAYANEAWGGPDQVHRYLSDANSDWAQQLKETKTYLDQHHITNCWFAYFADGAIQPDDYGIHCNRLPTTSTLWWLNLPQPEIPATITGTVLISDSDLEGIEFGEGALNPYDSFRGIKPTALIQHGLFVYDGTFAMPLASALVHAHKADVLLSAGNLVEALSEAQAALALAPQSAQVQTAAGDVLLKTGDLSEARQHYEAAVQSAQEIEPALQSGLLPGLRSKLLALPKE